MTEETAGTPTTNAPEIIYLQDGGEDEPLRREFYDDQVTWCADSIADNDTKYIRFDVHEREVAALTTQRDQAERVAAVCYDIHAVLGVDWGHNVYARIRELLGAEAQRDELQKRIGYTAVPVAEGGARTTASGRALLEMADVFYGPDEDSPESAQTLNMNDVWGWAIAWGEYVPDDRLSEVAALFRRYGDSGLLYWVSEQHEQMRSEFEDVNRRVDFVRQEERLRKEIPSSTERAYKKISYTLPTLATGTAQATECETNGTELRAELDAAKRALAEAVELIKAWHNMGMPKAAADHAWGIYYAASPEMQSIRETVAALAAKSPLG